MLKAITNDEEYLAALSRIEVVFDAELGTPESDECIKLADMVEAYENIHYPIPETKYDCPKCLEGTISDGTGTGWGVCNNCGHLI